MLRKNVIWLVLFETVVLIFPPPAPAQIINSLRGFEEDKQGWTGNTEGTASFAEGNSEYVQIDFGAAIQHQAERHRWRLLGGYTRIDASGKDVAESRLGHLRHNYKINSWLASIVFVQGQYDPFRRIKSRILAGLGGRFDLITDEKIHAAIGTAAMREDEKLTVSPTGYTTRYRFSFFLSLFRDVAKGVDVDVTAFYQPVVDDFSDARAFTNASLRVDIVGSLYILFNYNFSYNAIPPEGVQKADHRIRSGLGYEF